MRHKKIKSLLEAYYDGEINERERIIIEKHLEECNECHYELSLLERIEESVIDKICEPEENYWTSFPERVKERILIKEREISKKAKPSFLKNIFLRPVSMKLAGAIASIVIIVMVSIFYYENFKPHPETLFSEKESVSLHLMEQSEKVKKETYNKEELQSVPSPQQKDKKREIKTPPPDKILSETKKEAEEQMRMLRVDEEKEKISHEELIPKVSGAKISLEEIQEEEKIYQEGLKFQQKGDYDKAMQSYQYIIHNYPQGKRAPHAQFQVNTISSFQLERPFDEYSLRKRIQLWRDFIKKYPDSELIPSAKRNLAEIFYQLAFLTKHPQDIEDAISAVEDFMGLATEEKERFEKMLEELRSIK